MLVADPHHDAQDPENRAEESGRNDAEENRVQDQDPARDDDRPLDPLAHPQVCDRKRDQKKYDSGKKRHVEPNHRKDYGQSRTHPCQYDRVGAACLEISHTVSFTVNL